MTTTAQVVVLCGGGCCFIGFWFQLVVVVVSYCMPASSPHCVGLNFHEASEAIRTLKKRISGLYDEIQPSVSVLSHHCYEIQAIMMIMMIMLLKGSTTCMSPSAIAALH